MKEQKEINKILALYNCGKNKEVKRILSGWNNKDVAALYWKISGMARSIEADNFFHKLAFGY